MQSVIGRDCYRGTYGSLTLFTCPLTHVRYEPFATVSSDKPLCVIESNPANSAAVSKILALADVELLWSDDEYTVVASRTESTIHPSICSSSSEFNGYARNAYTVALHSFQPSDLNIMAGQEPVEPLDTISDFIAHVNADDLKEIDTNLAFGNPNGHWDTRNSYGDGAKRAVNWTIQNFQNQGANVSRFTFRTDMCDNVVAEFRGVTFPNQVIVVGSHLDSRSTNNTSPTQIAPGADDNGSGTAINLLFARLINSQLLGKGVRFQRTLRLMTFCGEEQGLVGSRAIAANYKTNNVNVTAMYNIDMVGYQPPNTRTVIAFMTGSATPALTTSCRNVMNTYIPATLTGTTSACCSDQQAFFENGFPSIGVFETNSSGVLYPDYHRSTDTPDKVSFEQVKQFAQGMYSCVLTAVGFA